MRQGEVESIVDRSSPAMGSPAIAARLKKPDRAAEDPARAIAELEAQIAKIAEDRDMWRDRALMAEAPRPAGPDFRPTEVARAQELQWMAQAQQNAMQNAQLAYQQGLGTIGQLAQHQGLLGAQALQMPGEWCNCVPARHDMFLPRR